MDISVRILFFGADISVSQIMKQEIWWELSPREMPGNCLAVTM